MTEKLFQNGDREWRDSQGRLHRDGGLPALIRANGYQSWWINGKRHRDDINGEDQPAVVWNNDDREWWVNGDQHRDGDLPAYIGMNGDQIWCVNGKRHRDGDQPAVVWDNGDRYWYVNGERHRDNDLPAVVWNDGDLNWWINGSLVRLLGYSRNGPFRWSGVRSKTGDQTTFDRDGNKIRLLRKILIKK